MRQHITIEQWDEINRKQKNRLDDFGCKEDYRMNIGQMIEFLGNESLLTINNFGNRTIFSITNAKINKIYNGKCLCDALWEAVKYKLNNN